VILQGLKFLKYLSWRIKPWHGKNRITAELKSHKTLKGVVLSKIMSEIYTHLYRSKR